MSSSSFSVEHDFIILLLAKQLERANQLTEFLDCEELSRLLEIHKISSAIGPLIESLDNDKIKTLLHDKIESDKLYQLGLIRELHLLKSAFDTIPFIPIKGPTLSQFIFNNPAERNSWDLDILIRPENLDTCKQILESLGYESVETYRTQKQKEALLKYHHQFEMYHSEKGILIELHWQLHSLRGHDIGFEQVFASHETCVIGNDTYMVMGWQQRIEYLCMHGTSHVYHRLQWLNDLKHIFESLETSQWTLLVNHMRSRKTEMHLALAIKLVETLFGCKFPLELELNKRDEKRCQILYNLSLQAQKRTSLNVKDTGWRDFVNTHRIQYTSGGIKGLLKSLFSRSVRPSNWDYFAFNDRVFFLNHLFMRPIWLLKRISKK